MLINVCWLFIVFLIGAIGGSICGWKDCKRFYNIKK
jgi:hypothetical protein